MKVRIGGVADPLFPRKEWNPRVDLSTVEKIICYFLLPSAEEVQTRQRGRSLISTNLEPVRGVEYVGTDRGWSAYQLSTDP